MATEFAQFSQLSRFLQFRQYSCFLGARSVTRETDQIVALEHQIQEVLSSLTSRQRTFCQVLGEGGESQASAAVKAGYSKNRAEMTGSRLMTYGKVALAVSLLRQKQQLQHGIAASEKRRRLLYIADKHRDDNPAAAVRALHELNLMDGHHAAIQVRHNHLSVNVSVDYQIDLPERVIDGELGCAAGSEKDS